MFFSVKDVWSLTNLLFVMDGWRERSSVRPARANVASMSTEACAFLITGCLRGAVEVNLEGVEELRDRRMR